MDEAVNIGIIYKREVVTLFHQRESHVKSNSVTLNATAAYENNILDNNQL